MDLKKRSESKTTRRDWLFTAGTVGVAAVCARTPRSHATGAIAAPTHASNGDIPVIASGDPPEPEFHGPRVVGCTPGKPFLFKVPFTSKGSVTLSVNNLPEGLRMTDDGIITGTVPHAGEYQVELSAGNARGKAARILKIISGEHKLALTPQMGWNSWNAYYYSATFAQEKFMREPKRTCKDMFSRSNVVWMPRL
ncbi:MAG: putative Ig domain-containing protein [Phycisphaerae bacterium]